LSKTDGRSTPDHLAETAKDTLDFFDSVGDGARTALEAKVIGPTVSSLAAVNTLTADRAEKALNKISEEKRRDLALLAEEPAIARIVVVEDDGEEKTVFISNGTPQASAEGGRLWSSYRAPMGRLAAIPVGHDHEVRLPSGVRAFEVQERALLRPTRPREGWDSKNTVFQSLSRGTLTIRSLRELIRSAEAPDEGSDLLDRLIAEDRKSANVIAGIQRSVIEKMGIRGQPILDEFQDDIFRLPLDSRLAILGPPGTGKTTTLIKRLGLKLDQNYLEQDESDLVRRSIAGSEGHQYSWLMFTPTELLKQYIKEAFARENIPASDRRIQTWTDYRFELARYKLGILRTSTGRGLILNDALQSLLEDTLVRQIEWFDDLETWQASAFWDDLRAQADILATNSDRTIAAVGGRLSAIVSSANAATQTAPLLALNGVAAEVSGLASKLRADVDRLLREAFAKELRQDNRLLDDLLAFLSTIGSSADVTEEFDDPDADDEEEEVGENRGDREEAFEAYMRAARTQARAAISKRSVSRRSRSGQILQWLGPRSLAEAERLAIGKILQVQTALRRFSNPLRQYLNRMPARYRRFRRERQEAQTWYLPSGFGGGEVSPLEVDAILLLMLRAGRALLREPALVRSLDEPRYATLKTIYDLYRTQVLVDEVTDFAPLQIACMGALCDPHVESFLACGDFNQRVTDWGTRSQKELKWVFPDFDIRTIDITYRHSRQLNELARALAALSGSETPLAELPPNVNSEGVAPVLAKGVSDDAVISWLGQRITEIERFTRGLPSTAIFVDGEDKVGPLAGALHKALADENIRVVACPGGQVVGQDRDVRVFDVQHIKGLEFEAVFFIGIDALARSKPGLFDKYLYVGVTRAATYLGLTCSSPDLPERITPLEGHFIESWSSSTRRPE
jgi:adenylate kinase family enzyme